MKHTLPSAKYAVNLFARTAPLWQQPKCLFSRKSVGKWQKFVEGSERARADHAKSIVGEGFEATGMDFYVVETKLFCRRVQEVAALSPRFDKEDGRFPQDRDDQTRKSRSCAKVDPSAFGLGFRREG